MTDHPDFEPAASVTIADLDESIRFAERASQQLDQDDCRVFLFDGTPAEFFAALRRAGVRESSPFCPSPSGLLTYGHGLDPIGGHAVRWDADTRQTIIGTREALRRWDGRDKDRWPPEGLEVGAIGRKV